jgi:uncharacterized protein (TIGR02284 family)
MILTYKKTERATIVLLNDLIKINNDRIGCYQQAIDQATNLDIDLKNLFKEIIAEGVAFKQELINTIKQLEGNPKDAITISGLIHRAWVDLKVTFTGNTRNAIINFCEYNEQVAQHTYKAALDMLSDKNQEVYSIVEKQQQGLMRSYASIRKCHEARNYLNPRLVYFN